MPALRLNDAVLIEDIFLCVGRGHNAAHIVLIPLCAAKHELVGVEYGEDIDAVTDTLIDVVCDDLAGLPENEHCEGCVLPCYRGVRDQPV